MTMEHLHRSFQATLFIEHPSIDPEEITKSLRIEPTRQVAAGPPRKPPYDRTVWSYKFDCKGARDLVPILEEIVERLESRRDRLRSLVESGARIELFCGVFPEFNWDEILPFELMAQLADLNINLRLDVYPANTQKVE